MNSLKKVLRNCKHTTYLIEKKVYSRLTLREYAALYIHLLGCSLCTRYSRQTVVINKMVKALFADAMKQTPQLDEAFKTELQQRIDNELNNLPGSL